jgi:hypothetical protein
MPRLIRDQPARLIDAFGVSGSSVVVVYDLSPSRSGIRSVDQETGRKVRWTHELPLCCTAFGVDRGRVLIANF